MEEKNKKIEPEEDTQEVESEIEKLKKEGEEYLRGWQRAKADFINYKKEEMSRLTEITKYATEDFILELITVLDNFDLAVSSLEKNGSVEKGVYMIRNQLFDIMRRRGLKRIEAKAGSEFDPNIAEAVAEVESDLPEGQVVEEIETGYALHDKLIRPARVKVSKGKK